MDEFKNQLKAASRSSSTDQLTEGVRELRKQVEELHQLFHQFSHEYAKWKKPRAESIDHTQEHENPRTHLSLIKEENPPQKN